MSDFASLTTAFSGLQLIVVMFVLMELRAIKDAEKRRIIRDDARDAKIVELSEKLSNVMGRLKIEDNDR